MSLLNKTSMLLRVLREESESQESLDYEAAGADPVEEGEVEEDDEIVLAYSPSSPGKNGNLLRSQARCAKETSNVVYEAASPKSHAKRSKRSHSREENNGGKEQLYNSTSDSDSDCVIVLD